MNNPHVLGTERIGKLLLQYSIPAIIAAGSLVAFELYQSGNFATMIEAVDGITYSFIASIIAIYVIMWWLKRSTFLPFVIYRIILGSWLLLDSYGFLQ